MKSFNTLVEERAIREHDIVLEEIARAIYQEDDNVTLDVLGNDGYSRTYAFQGVCHFYVPVDVGETLEKKTFLQRLKEISRLQCTLDKKSMNELLRESRQYKKTELFNAYMKRYGKKYDIVIVGGITEQEIRACRS